MKATAEKADDGFVTLEVEVEAEQFVKAVNKVYRQLAGKYAVPGFRRGKTPRPVLERFIGKERVYEDAINEVIPQAYREAVADTGIRPMDQPEVEVSQAEEGKPVIFKARVMVEPDVELGEYRGIEVRRPRVAVTPADVDRELARMRDYHAKLLTIEEGTVEEGDYLIIDFHGTIDGQPFEGGDAADYPLHLGEGQMLTDFERQLIGHAPGETVPAVITFPESYAKEDLAGKEASFTVTIKDVKRKELAPLDDEFARDVSEHDTLEELRAEIENRLRENANRAADSAVIRALREAVLERAAVDVPAALVEGQYALMKNDLDDQITRMGLTGEKYLELTGTTGDKLEADMREAAAREVRLGLILAAIARRENIVVTPEEVAGRITAMAVAAGKKPEDMLKLFEEKGEIPYVRDSLQRDKVLAFLREHAAMIDEEPPVEQPA